MKYSDSNLSLIKANNSNNFISKRSLEFLENTIEQIQDNWKKRQMFRTETEMHISVLNDISFPTRASKYWQAVREQSVMYQELVSLSFEYRKILVDLKEMNQDIEEMNDYDYDRQLIDIEEKEFLKLNIEQVAQARAKEVELWQKIMNKLDDGSFDTKDVNTHQLNSYLHEFENERKFMGDNGSPSEIANLEGKLNTAKRYSLLDESINLTDKIMEIPKNEILSSR